MSFKSRKGQKVVRSTVSLYKDEWEAFDKLGASIPCADRSETIRHLIEVNPIARSENESDKLGFTGVVLEPMYHNWESAFRRPVLCIMVQDLLKFLKTRENAMGIQWRMNKENFKTQIITNNAGQQLSEENRTALRLLIDPIPRGLHNREKFEAQMERMALRFSISLAGSPYPFFVMTDEYACAQLHLSRAVKPQFALTFRHAGDGSFFDTSMSSFTNYFDRLQTRDYVRQANYFNTWVRSEL